MGRAIKMARRSAWLALALGLGAATTAAALPAVVSAGEEAARVNPGRRVKAEPAANDSLSARWRLRHALDRAFGPDGWRKTSGYRSIAQENALRRQGAGTVARGRISRHSIGDADAPGAYDIVVRGLSQEAAAERLRRAAGGGWRVMAEGAHGREGPHLHIELVSFQTAGEAGEN